MELYDLFKDECRDILFSICRYMSYQDIQKLYLLNHDTFIYMKKFIERNRHLLNEILNKRFFERKENRFYRVDEVKEIDLFKRETYRSAHTRDWRNVFYDIDVGDIIYVKNKNQYRIIYNNYNKFFVKPIDLGEKFEMSIFPIDYWKGISKESPYRIWISCYTNDRNNIEIWERDFNIVLLNTFDPSNFLISYHSDSIYIH
jgi:hypothetical protein